jgi:hypothetical protein
MVDAVAGLVRRFRAARVDDKPAGRRLTSRVESRRTVVGARKRSQCSRVNNRSYPCILTFYFSTLTSYNG